MCIRDSLCPGRPANRGGARNTNERAAPVADGTADTAPDPYADSERHRHTGAHGHAYGDSDAVAGSNRRRHADA